MQTLTLMGVPITIESRQDILEKVAQWVHAQKRFVIVTPNPEILVAAQHNDIYKAALAKADVAIPDGTGIILAAQLYGIPVHRIRGRELFIDLLSLANQNKWNVYLLGATPEVIDMSIERIRKEYPGVGIGGSSDIHLTVQKDTSGVWLLHSRDAEAAIKDMNEFTPHLVFVALGHPKQEMFIEEYKKHIHALGFMCVGGTLDTFSGVKPLSPPWVAKIGFEWFYRLIHEPDRLFRILTATIVFPVYFFASFAFRQEEDL